MCRMIAFASAEPRDVAPCLAEMARLATCGNLVDGWERRPGGNHPDGWGIAFRQGDETHVVRSGKPANSDPLLGTVRAAADRFIGHIRYASNVATVNASNAHPFQAGGIVLAHNGTFYGAIGEEAGRRNVSDTLVFLERLARAWSERTFPALREVLSGMLSDPALVGDYSAANLLILADGALYALRNFRRDPDYYTLSLRAAPGEAVVASEPPEGEPGFRLLGNGELVELRPSAPRSAQVAFAP
ncbi:MAG: class II glutamine amidotransferase [Deltaproteobacteria bacterium]|nr:class II glutamine amidotransferase [Deltaproteobacteria bacterium]